MNQVWNIVDDYFDILLRDACNRVGLHPVKTKPKEWSMLLSAEGYNDVQRVHNMKIVTYVVHHLMDTHKLTDSFVRYFELRMNMPFQKDLIITDHRGKQIKLIELFKNKFTRFKSNFNHLTRTKYKVTISKGENVVGGKGKNLAEMRSHQEVLSRRREKRLAKKEHQGRIFFLNIYVCDGSKRVQVRLSNDILLKPTISNYMCNVQRLVYSNDRDWDQWEISFDANFWMTEEERKSMVEEEKLAIATRVNDEQQAAEALFGLIASVQNRASMTSTTSLPNKDDTELFFASEEAAKEIVDKDGSIHSKKQKSTFPPNRIVHEIPGRDVAPAPKGDSNNIEAPALCNIIPIVESEDREKKEEERGIQLKNEKQSYSIVTMFEKHKKGIQTSEKGKKGMLHR